MYIYRIYTWENGIRDFNKFDEMMEWIKKNPYSMRNYRKIYIYR